MASDISSVKHDLSMVISPLIEIIHNLESRDFDSFHKELERQGQERIEGWIRTIVDYREPDIQTDSELKSNIEMLSESGFSGNVYIYTEMKREYTQVELPANEGGSDNGTAFILGGDVAFIGGIQAAVDMLLFIMDEVICTLFCDSDSDFGFRMAMDMNENLIRHAECRDEVHSAFISLLTIEQSIYWQEKNYMSAFRPMYEDNLASMFRMVYTDCKIRTWDLADISYPLHKIRKAGKLILPEKKVSLLICQDLDAGGKYSEYLSAMKVRMDSLISIIHEIGHAGYQYMGLSVDEGFDPIQERYVQLLESDADFEPRENYSMEYFTDRSECFARCYEMYIQDCGFDIFEGKLDNPAYPKDGEFRTMVKEFFDRITEANMKGSIPDGPLDQYCNATE